MEKYKEFLKEYSGAIIGALVAIVILCTNLYRLIIGVILIAVGMFVGNYVQRNKYEVKEKPTLYHIGSMNWMPNEEGIHWFLKNVWDKIAKRESDLILNLAGRHMPKWLTNLRKKNINVVGEVPDAREFIRNNDIAIVPLLSGSGIRIKIIESMAMGRTVITTMVGAEGIQYSEYENIIIADSPAKMVEVICKIIKEPQEAERIGKNARKLVEDIYDNRKIIDRLLIFYDEIIMAKKEVTHIN